MASDKKPMAHPQDASSINIDVWLTPDNYRTGITVEPNGQIAMRFLTYGTGKRICSALSLTAGRRIREFYQSKAESLKSESDVK